MTRTETQLRVEIAVDPLAAVARLASSSGYDDYLVYEGPQGWVFAAGVVAAVELYRDELVVTVGDDVLRKPWSGRPAAVLDEALAALTTVDKRAYGWIGFEFCAYSFGAEAQVGDGQQLAHLIVPLVEVQLFDGQIQVRGGEFAEQQSLLAIATAADAPLGTGRAVELSSDPTDYRGRVRTAVGEIRAGRYQKVILSRRVDVPFQLDMSATYRLGRENNTPARSFLFRIGGLEATGFSPELVAAVDERGVVTTEPLAGTRAFGRGDAADLAARTDLEADPKEIVEHAVSVRTSFAEVASVAVPGTVSVSDFMAVRERGSVQHLASTVRGQLADSCTAWQALDALFPSVTASGIPKRESVDAIFRLDGAQRDLYSGAVVMVSPGGSLEATLVLRAAYQREGAAWLRAGAGVIGQSNPDREFEETCEKLGSIAPYLVPAAQ